jgi:uncharacterized protein (TIGR02757 family)
LPDCDAMRIPDHPDKRFLEALYRRYNKRGYITPDPLQFLHNYPDVGDREIAGMVASSLAYGRVAQIVRSVASALTRMGPSPAAFLREHSERQLHAAFTGFKHRFTPAGEIVALLLGIREAIRRHGSLNACFLAGYRDENETVLPALREFVAVLARGDANLIPCPSRGSACKRLNLYLRWMVRHDDVDPGGWTGVSPATLVIPLDTHMHRIGLTMGMTARKAADLKTALDITAAFRRIMPSDPVRYDFALTRLGIRGIIGRPRRIGDPACAASD